MHGVQQMMPIMNGATAHSAWYQLPMQQSTFRSPALSTSTEQESCIADMPSSNGGHQLCYGKLCMEWDSTTVSKVLFTALNGYGH